MPVWFYIAAIGRLENDESCDQLLLDDWVAKGHCKGEGAGGECAPFPHEAVETKISPFSNQNFDTENHYYEWLSVTCMR